MKLQALIMSIKFPSMKIPVREQVKGITLCKICIADGLFIDTLVN